MMEIKGDCSGCRSSKGTHDQNRIQAAKSNMNINAPTYHQKRAGRNSFQEFNNLAKQSSLRRSEAYCNKAQPCAATITARTEAHVPGAHGNSPVPSSVSSGSLTRSDFIMRPTGSVVKRTA